MLKDINKYGQSGAKIQVVGGQVLKRGNERVGRQGRWLKRWKHVQTLPNVYLAGPTWYFMEQLEPYDTVPRPTQVVQALWDVWQHYSREPMNCTADYHRQYIYRKLDIIRRIYPSFQLPAKLIVVLERVLLHWDELPHSLAHGDSTACNLMHDKKGRLKIIDPGSGEIVGNVFPDTPALDAGKLLYSGIGYERHRFDMDVDWTYNEVMCAVEDDLRPVELYAAQYFCAMHFYTSIPYTPLAWVHDMVYMMHQALEEISG